MNIEDVKPGMIYEFDQHVTIDSLSLRVVLSAKKRKDDIVSFVISEQRIFKRAFEHERGDTTSMWVP